MAKSKRKTYRSKRKYGKKRNPRTRKYRFKGGGKCDGEQYKEENFDLTQYKNDCKRTECEKQNKMTDISGLNKNDEDLYLTNYKLRIDECIKNFDK